MSSKFTQLLIRENIKKFNLKQTKKMCEKCPKKMNWTTDKKKRLNIKESWCFKNDNT